MLVKKSIPSYNDSSSTLAVAELDSVRFALHRQSLNVLVLFYFHLSQLYAFALNSSIKCFHKNIIKIFTT